MWLCQKCADELFRDSPVRYSREDLLRVVYALADEIVGLGGARRGYSGVVLVINDTYAPCVSDAKLREIAEDAVAEIQKNPGDPVRHVDGWTGTVRVVSLAYRCFEENRALVHRDDTQRSEWVRVEDLSDAPQQP